MLISNAALAAQFIINNAVLAFFVIKLILLMQPFWCLKGIKIHTII